MFVVQIIRQQYIKCLVYYGFKWITFVWTSDDGLWKLQAFSTLWSGLERCWHDDVYVPALVHRFWKLTLQQLSRHTLWLDQLYEEEVLLFSLSLFTTAIIFLSPACIYCCHGTFGQSTIAQ